MWCTCWQTAVWLLIRQTLGNISIYLESGFCPPDGFKSDSTGHLSRCLKSVLTGRRCYYWVRCWTKQVSRTSVDYLSESGLVRVLARPGLQTQTEVAAGAQIKCFERVEMEKIVKSIKKIKIKMHSEKRPTLCDVETYVRELPIPQWRCSLWRVPLFMLAEDWIISEQDLSASCTCRPEQTVISVPLTPELKEDYFILVGYIC